MNNRQVKKQSKKDIEKKLRTQIKKEINKANRRINTFAKPEYATTSAYDSVQNKLRKHSYGTYDKESKAWKFNMKKGLSNQSLKKELSALKLFNNSITAKEYKSYVIKDLGRTVEEQELIKKAFQRADNILDRELFDSRVIQQAVDMYNDDDDYKGSLWSYMKNMLDYEKEKQESMDEIEKSRLRAEKQAKFLSQF